MRNTVPFYSLMGAGAASGLGLSPQDANVSSFDAQYYIDYDTQTMYVPDGAGGWIVDPNATSVLQSAAAVSLDKVQQADTNTGGSSISSFFSMLQQSIPAIMQASAQKQLMDVNLQRAQKGLPPLNAASYTPGVNVGLTSDTQKMVMYLGGAALGVLALNSLTRGR